MRTLSLAVFLATLAVSSGHGRLIEPPSRASAWRFGFSTPRDYNDNEGFCGGKAKQHDVNGGRCGVCGDSWELQPRPHEVGGLYATGIIVRNYSTGQVIEATAQITANHKGFFEFRICPTNDPSIEATQDCLDRYPLYGVGSSDHRLYIGHNNGNHSFRLRLPQQLNCRHCVLQWRYVAGNDWGICYDGSGALGCGPQEEFRACADVSISADRGSHPAREARRRTTHASTNPRRRVTVAPVDDAPQDDVVLTQTGRACEARGIWRAVPGMHAWCTTNCNHTPAFCPTSHCWCT
ncbi:uncharacterized protein LOC108667142 [Hyalella azteca]|uniref:Uncharacterized protein LOC108667142 n=1 Tax=Hyalella azteca TaxID=294128 RepID=A0A8B7N7L5_HYAAZ|nr:uncharacterized protein LOC108667142 [Hyalella azteca]